MKHYCNRRIPKPNKPDPYPPPQNVSPAKPIAAVVPPPKCNTSNENDDDILLPPGASYSMFYDAGIIKPPEDYSEAQGGSVTQGSGYLKETGQTYMRPQGASITSGIPYDNMSGKFDFISIPHNNSDISTHTMTSFLDRYLSKFICLDLWTSDCIREEICGILIETGRNFLVITQPESEKVTMVDLRSVRYINVYCK